MEPRNCAHLSCTTQGSCADLKLLKSSIIRELKHLNTRSRQKIQKQRINHHNSKRRARHPVQNLNSRVRKAMKKISYHCGWWRCGSVYINPPPTVEVISSSYCTRNWRRTFSVICASKKTSSTFSYREHIYENHGEMDNQGNAMILVRTSFLPSPCTSIRHFVPYLLKNRTIWPLLIGK